MSRTSFDDAWKLIQTCVEVLEADPRGTIRGIDAASLRRSILSRGVSETTLGRAMDLLGFEKAAVWKRREPAPKAAPRGQGGPEHDAA